GQRRLPGNPVVVFGRGTGSGTGPRTVASRQSAHRRRGDGGQRRGGQHGRGQHGCSGGDGVPAAPGGATEGAGVAAAVAAVCAGRGGGGVGVGLSGGGTQGVRGGWIGEPLAFA